MAAIVLPALLVSSSLMAVRLMAPVLSSTGASLLMGLTTRDAVSDAVLNAVVPPLVDVST